MLRSRLSLCISAALAALLTVPQTVFAAPYACGDDIRIFNTGVDASLARITTLGTPDPRWTDRALGEAEVREAALASAHLLRCSLEELDLRGSELSGTTFEECSAVGSRFDHATADGVTVTTDDGSAGTQGWVSDVLPDLIARTGAGVLYGCGPMGMLRSMSGIAAEHGIGVRDGRFCAHPLLARLTGGRDAVRASLGLAPVSAASGP